MDSRLIVFLIFSAFFVLAHSFPTNSSVEGTEKKNETVLSNAQIEFQNVSSIAPSSTSAGTSSPTELTTVTTTKTPVPTTSTATTAKTPVTTTSTTTTTAKTPVPTTSTVTTPTTEPSQSSTATLPTTTEGKIPLPGTPGRQFDGPSFVGGIVLTVGLTAIGFVAFKFYIAGKGGDSNYRTLY